MAAYDEWNRIDEDDDDELQDGAVFEGKRDVILFAIDCSDSMHAMHDDPMYEDVQTSHVLTALEAAIQVQKKKVFTGPNDAVGIMLFNTARTGESIGQGVEIKAGNFLYQPIETISAPKVQELIQLVEAARADPNYLRETFPPLQGNRVAMGDVFTSCNWIMRDGAPKTATKRVFLLTDEDNPHSGPGKDRLTTAARTTLVDLVQAGIVVEPFFISTDEKPFDVSRFYSSVLLPTNIIDDDEEAGVLPEALSITRIEDLLDQMKFREVPKRALFSVPFQLAENLVIGVKGYGLVTVQKKGVYKYFVDLGDRMELAESRTVWLQRGGKEVPKDALLSGMGLGEAAQGKKTQDHIDEEGGVTRVTAAGSKTFYTADEIRSFRTLGLEPQIKLLGFKDPDTLAFEDNVKHSYFIYPDEMAYSGSKRTFSALLKTMEKKKKIGLVLALMRRNATPVFCAMLPQAEQRTEEGIQTEPPGMHLIPLPFADDMRAVPEQFLDAERAPQDLTKKAALFVARLAVKGGYSPDSYPNPALEFHNAQLQASAFREEFDPETFEDLSLPKYDMIHERVGSMMKEWKEALLQDESATVVVAPTTSNRRKAKTEPGAASTSEAEVRRLYENSDLDKLKLDQLKDYLRSKGLSVTGKKADLVDRVSEWLDNHSG
ncbi:Ku DNA-binding complex, Ku70 subunit [Phanerochaete sordida]|uniref:ATP-dependent DNA helicase II subunit 1 n=1 Tax=Phanerochaete sordida TaxID=48140 RepID=A0A9P3L8L3_9APHY|nr:Ku DNA-binding complex, Ku70 subunit [Phanerochaete sordida]